VYDVLRLVGVDLGQKKDPTAITVIERGYVPAGPLYNETYWHKGRQVFGAREPIKLEYHVRHLERPPLETSYVDIVERIISLLASLRDKELVLAVDTTGVGRPVADMLRRRLWGWLEASGEHRLKCAWITITGGESVTRIEGGGLRVPKRDLASAPLVLMQNKQLKIAEGLELADTLKRELLNFKVKINIATGHDSYEAWREGDHDDLVLAVAMACWCGEKYLKKETSRPVPGVLAEDAPIIVVGRKKGASSHNTAPQSPSKGFRAPS
jgi:hypothetical protein